MADGQARYSATNRVLLHQGKAVATNGRVLTVLPLTGETPPYPCLVEADSIKADAKKDATICVNGSVKRTVAKKVSLHELPEQEGRFPCCGRVMPDVTGTTILAIDINYLMELAKGISPNRVLYLMLPKANEQGQIDKPVSAVSYNEDGSALGVGVIVPLCGTKGHVSTAREDFKAIADTVFQDNVSIEPHKEEAAPVVPEPVAVAA